FQLPTTVRAYPELTREQHRQLGSDKEITRSSLRHPATTEIATQLRLWISFLRAGLLRLCGARFTVQESGQADGPGRGPLNSAIMLKSVAIRVCWSRAEPARCGRNLACGTLRFGRSFPDKCQAVFRR